MDKKEPGGAGVVSIVFAVLNATALVVSVGWSLRIRHKFIGMYEDLAVELPRITQMVLSIHWGALVVGMLLLLSALAIKELISKKWIPLLLNGLFALFGVLCWGLFVVALFIPMMGLIQQIEGG